MMTRTQLTADLGPKSPFSLRAEVLLLLIITIFGIIGLSFCIGLCGESEDYSAGVQNINDTELIKYDRQSET